MENNRKEPKTNFKLGRTTSGLFVSGLLNAVDMNFCRESTCDATAEALHDGTDKYQSSDKQTFAFLHSIDKIADLLLDLLRFS